MKRLKTVGLALLIVVVLVGIVGLVAEPEFLRRMSPSQILGRATDGTMGIWLDGEVVTGPVTDWSFADTAMEIRLETSTPYFLPHWITTFVAREGNQVFVFSDYYPPAPGKPDLRDRFPEARFWNRNVLRDPRIRLKIGERIYPVRAYALTDPNDPLIEVARQAFLRKYAQIRREQALPEARRPRMHFFRVETS